MNLFQFFFNENFFILNLFKKISLHPETFFIQNLSKFFSNKNHRLLSVDFHPVADNVLIAFDAGKQVRFFDLETASEKFALPDVHKALPTNISWNLDGSVCATSCKDKTLRIFDPRANSVSDVKNFL